MYMLSQRRISVPKKPGRATARGAPLENFLGQVLGRGTANKQSHSTSCAPPGGVDTCHLSDGYACINHPQRTTARGAPHYISQRSNRLGYRKQTKSLYELRATWGSGYMLSQRRICMYQSPRCSNNTFTGRASIKSRVCRLPRVAPAPTSQSRESSVESFDNQPTSVLVRMSRCRWTFGVGLLLSGYSVAGNGRPAKKHIAATTAQAQHLMRVQLSPVPTGGSSTDVWRLSMSWMRLRASSESPAGREPLRVLSHKEAKAENLDLALWTTVAEVVFPDVKVRHHMTTIRIMAATPAAHACRARQQRGS